MSKPYEFSHCGKVTAEGLNIEALIFRRVRDSGKIERADIIPELQAVALSCDILTPKAGRLIKRENNLAQFLLLRENDPKWLVELIGEGVDSQNDEQVEAIAEDAFTEWSQDGMETALEKSKHLRRDFIGERIIEYGFSAELMDLPESETVDSRPSWLAASSELMAKSWPSLSGADTEEGKLLAYYIDRARHFGTDAPSEIKAQIRGELRKAKNAHRKRSGKKHRLALEILVRWHELATLTASEIQQQIGIDCTVKSVERTLERLKIDRPVNRRRPSPDG